MDIGLDEALPVTDPDGHHGIHGDAVGGQVAARTRDTIWECSWFFANQRSQSVSQHKTPSQETT